MRSRPRLAFGMLVRSGRVLLVHRRADRVDYPSTWDLPGGHLEPGETPEEALRREVREEIGVEVGAFAEVEFPLFFPAAETHVFLVTDWVGEPTNTAPEEHDDLRWVDASELAGLTITHEGFRAWLMAQLG